MNIVIVYWQPTALQEKCKRQIRQQKYGFKIKVQFQHAIYLFTVAIIFLLQQVYSFCRIEVLYNIVPYRSQSFLVQAAYFGMGFQ